MKVAIIGGGAGGFFAAIQVKNNHPTADVVIYEKSKKVLSKVKVSGGGRCNVTNSCESIPELIKAYPRGEKKLKHVFHEFSNLDTFQWFENEGVPLTIQEDNCVFPVSQDSQSIIDCFLKKCTENNIQIKTQASIEEIQPIKDHFELKIKNIAESTLVDKVIIATGGSPKMASYEWIKNLGHTILQPIPSLFTFNMPHEKIKELMGVVVENGMVRIQGEKIINDGPILITHWGMSGPAILKTSAYGAKILYDKGYSFNIQVNWVHETNLEKIREKIVELKNSFKNKNLGNIRPYFLPERLWHFLLNKMGYSLESKWSDVSKKMENKIIEILSNDVYSVEGKTTFKEEFVTCGGVDLNEVNMRTMESKIIPGLYFTGEVLDIDAITGGYNFQAAWSTAYTAGQLKA